MIAPVITKEEAKRLISTNVDRLMHEQGIGQRELSRLSGMDQPRISLLVKGKLLPNPADLANVAEALGTTTDGLLPVGLSASR